jgi:hypothetical protein
MSETWSESAVPTSQIGTKQMTPFSILAYAGRIFSGQNASGNLKQHEKVCRGPKKLHFCQYCAKQFKLNWLIIRHEKGCRDRPG